MNRRNKTDKFDEIGQMLVPRALDWTKKIRKAAADIFAKFGLDKPGKNAGKLKCSPDFSSIFPWVYPKTG